MLASFLMIFHEILNILHLHDRGEYQDR